MPTAESRKNRIKIRDNFFEEKKNITFEILDFHVQPLLPQW